MFDEKTIDVGFVRKMFARLFDCQRQNNRFATLTKIQQFAQKNKKFLCKLLKSSKLGKLTK